MAARPPLPLRPLAALLIVAAAGLLSVAATRPPERQQELRVLLCARSMAEGGSWVVPEFQGQPRLRKPPLMYWVTALPTRLHDALWTARLPGVLAGLGLVAGTWWLGRHTLGDAGGLAGGLALASSRIWWQLGPSAETDTLLSLCVLLAVGWIWQAQTRTLTWGRVGAAMGVGFLTKGPAAVVLPLWATVISFRAGRGSPGSRWMRLAGAVAVAALIAVPWYAWIRWMVPESQAIIARELSDTFGEATHPGPPWYWLYTLPKALLPWGLWLPVAAWRAIRRRQDLSPGEQFLWIWLAGGVVLLTLTPQKQEHYAMLLAPVALLLTASDLFSTRMGTAIASRLAQHLRPLTLGAALGAVALIGGVLPTLQPDTRQFHQVGELAPQVQRTRFVHVVGRNSAWFEYALHRPVENLDDPVAGWRRARSGEWLICATEEGPPPGIDRIPVSPSFQGPGWAAWEKP